MPNNDNVGQQLQSYLPGMSPPTEKIKRPHQMTPEEFAAHPYAVFHSSHLPQEDVTDTNKRPYGGGIHVGTEQAAIERHVATSHPRDIKRYSVGARPMKSDARLHTFWHEPHLPRLDEVISDEDANEREPKGYDYYKNVAEDKGSISLVTSRPQDLKTQAEYVRQAIQNKKEHEVPAKTMEMYRQGVLDKGAWLPRSFSLAHTTPRAEDVLGREDIRSIPEPLNVAKLPQEEQENFHAANNGSWQGHQLAIEPRPRVSNNGPDIERMKTQYWSDATAWQRA